MKYVKMLGLLAVAAAALMAFAGTASATILTSPANTLYTGNIHASAGLTQLHGEAFTDECTSSTVSGTVTAHGSQSTVSGPITTLDFSGCKYPVTVLAPGTLEIHTHANDPTGTTGNGTLTSTGATITIHGPFGINCEFTTNATDVGTLTGSKHQISTGLAQTATLDINSAKIPRTGHSPFCGNSGIWTGDYTVTTPDYLDVD